AATRCPVSAAPVGLRNPIMGVACCSARAPSGQTAAATPTNVMNSRRLMSTLNFEIITGRITILEGRGDVSFRSKADVAPLHSMTSSALAIKPGERRSPCVGSRLDNSEKVQPALDADTQVALTYAVRIQRNLRHRYHHKKKI